jgi:hypothetical protein
MNVAHIQIPQGCTSFSFPIASSSITSTNSTKNVIPSVVTPTSVPNQSNQITLQSSSNAISDFSVNDGFLKTKNPSVMLPSFSNPLSHNSGLSMNSDSTPRAIEQTLLTRNEETKPPTTPLRLNKFVKRLHDMLVAEKESGIVEWQKGLLVLHSTDAFTKKVLPKYFNTKNFKTFRRQLNYYGFVHVRSFSATGTTTTALWVNQELAKYGSQSISSVLMLKRVEPSESAKTAEGRRVRKEEAVSTVEDIGINTRSLQLDQIRNMVLQNTGIDENYLSGLGYHIEASPEEFEVPTPVYKQQDSVPAYHSTKMNSEDAPNPENKMKKAMPTVDSAANMLLMLSKAATCST